MLYIIEWLPMHVSESGSPWLHDAVSNIHELLDLEYSESGAARQTWLYQVMTTGKAHISYNRFHVATTTDIG